MKEGIKMSKQRAYKLAEKIGAEINDIGEYIQIEAPYGKCFEQDLHGRNYYVEIYGRGGVWSDIIEDLTYLEKCKVVDTCDYCQSNKPKTEGSAA
jgi:hypothetical protein